MTLAFLVCLCLLGASVTANVFLTVAWLKARKKAAGTVEIKK